MNKNINLIIFNNGSYLFFFLPKININKVLKILYIDNINIRKLKYFFNKYKYGLFYLYHYYIIS